MTRRERRLGVGRDWTWFDQQFDQFERNANGASSVFAPGIHAVEGIKRPRRARPGCVEALEFQSTNPTVIWLTPPAAAARAAARKAALTRSWPGRALRRGARSVSTKRQHEALELTPPPPSYSSPYHSPYCNLYAPPLLLFPLPLLGRSPTVGETQILVACAGRGMRHRRGGFVRRNASPVQSGHVSSIPPY